MTPMRTEFFGYFLYSPDLTYEELLAREEEFKEAMGTILTACKAEYLHFEADGDSLRVQCSLAGQGEDLFHTISEQIAPLMKNGLDGRLLFVDTSLHVLHMYSLHEGRWQEGVITLPLPGHLEKAESVQLNPAVSIGSRNRLKKA